MRKFITLFSGPTPLTWGIKHAIDKALADGTCSLPPGWTVEHIEVPAQTSIEALAEMVL